VHIRIAAIIIAIVLPLAALVLILDRRPDWQQSQWAVALGIFSSFTSTIAAYEFIIKRFLRQNETDGKSGQSGIGNGQHLQITGGEQGTITQQDQRGQNVQGSQTNVAGNLNGPNFSGQFQGDFIYQAAAKPRLPLQKPTRAQHFIGREKELTSLLQDLQPGRVITICGPGGMGKTALAAEAIWQLAPGNEPSQKFPDGIICHSFYHRPQAALVLEAIAMAYGEDPRAGGPLDAAKRALDGRQALIFLDGTEVCEDLQTVLSITASCGVLITTRRHSDAPADFSDLPPLPLDKAVQLLQAWAGTLASDRDICQSICKLLGCLPLAIFLVGRYMAQRRQMGREYLAWLEKTPLKALDLGERQHQSIPLLMEHSLAQVSDQARDCLGVAGVLAQNPFEPDIIAVAREITVADANLSLGELVDFGLLTRPDDCYRIAHALVHTYARSELPMQSSALSRLAEYYNEFIRKQTPLGPPGYVLLDAQREHILSVQSACHKAELWRAVRKLTWAIREYLDLQGHWTVRVAVLQAGLDAARHDEARYDEASFLNSLGLAYADLGDARKAIEYYEKALAIFRTIGKKLGEGAALGNLGVAYKNLGDSRKAIEYHEQALAIDREIGDRRGEGADLGNLGSAYYNLGDARKAIEYHEQDLTIAREIGHKRGEAIALWNKSLDLDKLDNRAHAIECAKASLKIREDIEYPRADNVRRKLQEWESQQQNQ
jgi:tetratricopeptide (TPR) repeat protein